MASNALSWLLVACAFLLPGIALVEWLMGEEGVQRTKDRLADWYVFVEDGDWSRLIASSALVTEAFLRRMLGERLVSFRSLIVWFLFSVPLSAIAFHINHVFQDFGLASSIAGIIFVFVTDYAFLIIGRSLLRQLGRTTSPGAALGFLGYTVLASYIAVGLFFAAGSNVAFDQNFRIQTLGSPQHWATIVLLWPRTFARDIVSAGSPQPFRYSLAGAALLIMPAMLSTVLFGAVVGGAGILYILRLRAQNAVALFIERIAGLKSGVLTAAATLVTTAVAIMTVLQHATH